jgi:LmbE family N-acetylglucosaminyl deacetylase
VRLSTIWPGPGEPVTIVAPHPDDEVFGVGGIMSRLVRGGHRLRLVAVTEGEAAFGPATPGRRRELARRRARERVEALDRLGVAEHTEVVRLGLPDGGVDEVEEELAEVLASDASSVVLATWRHDGHRDHEAVGRAAVTAAASSGGRLFEYAVWAHLDPAWRPERGHRVPLDRRSRDAKGHAIDAFDSQLEVGRGGSAVVPEELVNRLRTNDEVLIG